MKKKKDWKWKAKCLEKSELRSTFPKVEIKANIKKGEQAKEDNNRRSKGKIRKLSEENVSSENDTICYNEKRYAKI